MFQTFDDHADVSFGQKHLPLIRAEMARQGLDVFVIPHEDEHNNEYLPAANDRLAWATGFTGSAGAAVVTKDAAVVLVDGRYTLQVKAQVDASLFEFADLVDLGAHGWLEAHVKPGEIVGYDPRLHTPDALARIAEAVRRAGGELRAVSVNPLDAAWADRPAQPKAKVVPQPTDFSGEHAEDKRARLGEALAKAGAEAAVITAPPSIAWLFNIRGGDVIRSPLPLAQAILDRDGSARLFLDPDKVTDGLQAWLGNQVALQPPEALPAALAELKGKAVLVDAS